jgi:hypothetical protein
MTEPRDLQLQRVENELAALRADINSLLEAWRAAQGMVRFIKFLGGMATAVTAVWAMAKLGSGK